MHLLQPRLIILLLFSLSTQIFASLTERKLCIKNGEVCHLTGESCCDGFKCALAHGGKANVGYCTESGFLLQDYYQVRLP
ncbi:predicted protein [Sclerotinia sclerotiorum 1980 UF-70]|uniref:Uncharacterized protein n=1 Tax=Sclerotinia sclerotiorum (strain ATCC 18683 / 1980 / Ss-1) TaxID=665079 RepID=A7EBW4_SCLS1|nr:predicted protein [Sclerotinia sclerotiorum 1980 UF-70]EDN99942.1 predicted protein [Sclerotinia sclerotiorum 1980 UF-70]